MKFVASAGIGLLLAIVFAIIPTLLSYIPFLNVAVGVCTCVLWPLATLAAGYGAASFAQLKKDDWTGLATEVAVLSLVYSVIALVINLVVVALGFGTSMISGSDMLSSGAFAGLGVVASICGLLTNFMMTFVVSFIGGLIFMVTKK
ncbi:MAG: hypothetical protein N3H30_00400 [Candidatus Micrarchaeota archaeon]|nr:hypothetical protein [Candidatus Micrarchaeota archaeon]